MFKNKGFTLIELLVVIAIIGILASIVVVSVNPARVRARDTKRKADLRTLQTALESYYYKNKSYVSGNLVSYNNPTSKWGGGACIPSPCKLLYEALVGNNFLSELPKDPVNRVAGNPLNFLLGDPSLSTTGLGYLYYSVDGQGYILGTKLEQGWTASTDSKCGNYKVTGGNVRDCQLP